MRKCKRINYIQVTYPNGDVKKFKTFIDAANHSGISYNYYKRKKMPFEAKRFKFEKKNISFEL